MKVVIVGFDMKHDNSVFYKKLDILYLTDAKIGKAIENGFFKGARYFSFRILGDD